MFCPRRCSPWSTDDRGKHHTYSTYKTKDGRICIRGYWKDEEDCLNQAIAAARHLQKKEPEKWSDHIADFCFALGNLSFKRGHYDQAVENFSEIEAL